MKKHWILWIILGMAIPAKAQSSEASRFVQYTLRNFDKFIFTKLDDHWIRHIALALEADTLRSEEQRFLYHEPERILILSESERKYVLKELRKSRTVQDYSQLLESGTVFVVDSTSGRFYHNKGRIQPKLAGINDESWCGFSIPIFIRDNTLCIFYNDTGRQGRLAVYRKTSDAAWLPWLIVFTWIS